MSAIPQKDHGTLPKTAYVDPANLKDHTPGHVPGRCPPCDEMRSSALESLTPALTLKRAAEMFMSMRSLSEIPGALSARYVRKNTEKGYKRHAESLELFFAGMSLGEICWHNMLAYQRARVAGAPPFVRFRRPQDAKERKVGDQVLPPKGKTPCPCKPQQCNQELAFLKRLKILAGCWTREDGLYYRELQEDEGDLQRALTPEEQSLWLDMARSNERWSLIYFWSVVAFDTTMSTNELRGLRLCDVNLQHRLVDVPWPCAKNKYRRRTIALEDGQAIWAFEELLRRAHELGSRDPQDYLFPARDTRRNCYIPTRHMSESGIKKLWEEVRQATRLTWFRPYDCRHTGATRYAEQGMPIHVLMSRMGHISERMQRHYVHISERAQRPWLRNSPQHGYAPRQEARPWGGAVYGRARA